MGVFVFLEDGYKNDRDERGEVCEEDPCSEL